MKWPGASASLWYWPQLCPFVVQLLFLCSAGRRPGSLQLGLCRGLPLGSGVCISLLFAEVIPGLMKWRPAFSSPTVLDSSARSPAGQMCWYDSGESSLLRTLLHPHPREIRHPAKPSMSAASPSDKEIDPSSCHINYRGFPVIKPETFSLSHIKLTGMIWRGRSKDFRAIRTIFL